MYMYSLILNMVSFSVSDAVVVCLSLTASKNLYMIDGIHLSLVLFLNGKILISDKKQNTWVA